MSEFRQDLATKEWIIIATERARRPGDFAHSHPPSEALPANSATCPFCPGNEAMTPNPILEIPAGTEGKWDVRVVPNKFPALAPREDGSCVNLSNNVGPFLRRDGLGHHEVIVETPFHNRDLPLLPAHHIEHIVQAYRLRYMALVADCSTEMVLIFRNHGLKAGTSLIHPHSQVVASSVVPFPVRNRLYEGQRYFDTTGRCVYCTIIEYELQDQTRVVMESPHFLVVCPYASSVPFQVLIIPKHHQATFGSIDNTQVHDLAATLQNVLARIWRLLGDPDYNYVIDTAPNHMRSVPFYHWHLEILPKLTTPAGFEIGSGIGINVVQPEKAAAELRATDGSRVPLDTNNLQG